MRKKFRALEVAAKDSQKIADWTGPGVRCAKVNMCPRPVVSALECDKNDAIEYKLEYRMQELKPRMSVRMNVRMVYNATQGSCQAVRRSSALMDMRGCLKQ